MPRTTNPSRAYECLARYRRVLAIGLHLGTRCNILLPGSPMTRIADGLRVHIDTTGIHAGRVDG